MWFKQYQATSQAHARTSRHHVHFDAGPGVKRQPGSTGGGGDMAEPNAKRARGNYLDYIETVCTIYNSVATPCGIFDCMIFRCVADRGGAGSRIGGGGDIQRQIICILNVWRPHVA